MLTSDLSRALDYAQMSGGFQWVLETNDPPSPSLEVSHCPHPQEITPGRFEPGARCHERRASTANAFAGVGSGIEAATPLPLIDVSGNAGTARNRPDTDIAKEDPPAVLAIGITAALKGWHVR